jgi:hypothetical protein
MVAHCEIWLDGWPGEMAPDGPDGNLLQRHSLCDLVPCVNVIAGIWGLLKERPGSLSEHRRVLNRAAKRRRTKTSRKQIIDSVVPVLMLFLMESGKDHSNSGKRSS